MPFRANGHGVPEGRLAKFAPQRDERRLRGAGGIEERFPRRNERSETTLGLPSGLTIMLFKGVFGFAHFLGEELVVQGNDLIQTSWRAWLCGGWVGLRLRGLLRTLPLCRRWAWREQANDG